VFEYSEKVQAGLTPRTDTFGGYYYLLTGLHLVHVLGGMVLLGCVVRLARSGRPVGGRLAFVEFSACFWHMVDLLWIVLFPLLYLVQ
jgi:nitric oxide reductase NorE protein